jgi:aminomethyltransferase
MDTTLQAETSAALQLKRVLTGAGFAPLNETGWIRIAGSDRVRWLNGMLTNSIQALGPGQGCYNLALNSQGRIQGDASVFAPPDDPDALLIETERSQLERLMSHLDHFVIMDDVELSDVTAERFGLLLVGTKAVETLRKLQLSALDEPLAITAGEWNGERITIIRALSPLVPRLELWTNFATAQKFMAALPPETARLSPETLEYLRILEGTPRYGVDIRDTDKAHDLPQETTPVGAESRALHFSKGCYLGQEIVERIRSRGNVHRVFSGFQLTGAVACGGTPLQAGGKPAGELTSVAVVPLPGRAVQLALGYVRREALDRKLTLEYPGGTALPVVLPFRDALGSLTDI